MSEIIQRNGRIERNTEALSDTESLQLYSHSLGLGPFELHNGTTYNYAALT